MLNLPANPDRPVPKRASLSCKYHQDSERLAYETHTVIVVRENTPRQIYVLVYRREFHTAHTRRFEIEAVPRRLSFARGQQPVHKLLYNKIEILVELATNTAWLGPKGWIVMSDDELKNCGIGSYLLGNALTWLKTNYPDAAVATGYLSSNDATEDNRHRRDRFYRRQGLTIVYSDPESGDGNFWIDRAEDLSPSWNTEKVTELSAWSVIERLSEQDKEIKELRDSNSIQSLTVKEIFSKAQKYRGYLIYSIGVNVVIVLIYILFKQYL